MKKINQLLLSTALIGLVLSSCSKSSDSPDNGTGSTGTGNTKFIITATPVGTTGIADYLLTTDDLTKGTITTAGNGVEQDGTYRYYITSQNKFFSLLYGQGNPGAVTTYALDAGGKIVKTSNFQSESVHVFAAVNNDILTIKVPRSGASLANFYRIDATKSIIAGEAQIDIAKMTGTKERGHFTWATQFGDKVLAPYMSIKGDGIDNFGTAYPDSTWVAVLSYPDLKLEKVIKDNRTSYLGAYYTDGLVQVENGDAYGFSPAAATNNGVPTSTKPSAIVRIKKGTTEFDQSYFFNVQEKSGGHHISSQTYVGNGKFLLHMYGNANALTGNRKLAIADVYNQTFTWVTGAPADILSSSTRYNLTSDDHKIAYLGINTANGNWVYAIDTETAKATPGIKVEGGTITAISKLKY
jgi:hypothetical protein